MTGQVEQVDWEAVERRERRMGTIGVPVLAAYFMALLLLTGRYAFWEGRAAWVALGVFVGVVLVVQVAAWFRRRTGPRVRMLRFRYALLHRVYPGPGVREKVDAAARQMAGMGWLAWFFPFGQLGLLLGGRWDQPLLSVPAALVVVGATAWFVLYWRRMTAAARRWVADPPGPDREVPPPTRRERLTSGRNLVWFFVGLIVVGVVAGLILGIFFSD